MDADWLLALACSSARNTLTGMNVAIKKALKPFSTPTHCKRTYRELALLKHMHHENVRLTRVCGVAVVVRLLTPREPSLDPAMSTQVIELQDVFITPTNDLYFVTELLGADLHQVIVSQPLDMTHIQYFLYQILRALKVHCAASGTGAIGSALSGR